MKERLLELVACPECGGDELGLERFSEDGDEVVEGMLRCASCARRYPIIGGVPRLLPDALIGTLAAYHPDFFARHGVDLADRRQGDDVSRTLRFYSYARPKLFSPQIDPALLQYWRESLTIRIPGANRLSGLLGLDAGCGEGRYTYCLAESGAEVVGMDLSEAVSLAYLRNRSQPRAHVVQGSIFQPPIRRGSLDFVVSTGVLHHLPDPQGGFEALVPLLHPGGSIHIWVYGLHKMSPVYRLSHLTFLRRLGSRLSPRASYLLSVPIGLALHLVVFRPIQLLSATRVGRDRINPQLRELASLPLRMHIAEVQDRIGVPITFYLSDEQLRDWFERAGLEGIVVQATHGGRGWSASGHASRATSLLSPS